MDSYWRDREEQAAAEYQLTEEEYVKELNDIYDYMLDQVKKEINGFYSKYATKEGITMAEAQKRVAQVDIEEYQRKAKKYVEEKDFSAQANREMRLYNLTMKVNRLQMLEANIGLETVSGFDELSEKLGEDLNERALREMSRQAGILGATVNNNAKTANSIVGASFHNATFSDRIWMYQAQLRDELDGLLRNGLIQGQNPNELARHINKLFDTGKYNCERLLRTELTRVQSDAQLQSFVANGFDEYQFNALGNACPDCRALDEQHFKIADAQPGENLPPIHPNCKCAVSAWMDTTDFDEWLDTYPDHGMDYQDWLENRPTAVEEATEEPSVLKFVEAKSIEEAEAFAKSCGIESAAYKGMDLQVANAMNQSLVDILNYCPELKGKLKCYGIAQQLNREYKAAVTPYFQKWYAARHEAEGDTPEEAAAKAESEGKKYASRFVGSVPSRAYAFSRSGDIYGADEELAEIGSEHRGVCVNEKWAKNYDGMMQSITEDVSDGYHPAETATMRSIFDHEFGHQIDATYGLSDWDEMNKLYYGHSKQEISSGLSRYATKNIAEFIAEGYNEYVNSPEPRELATQIGGLIDKRVKGT